jgi:hypothetical protein
MIREWLLIIWIGTSTNFSLHSVHWSQEECNHARSHLLDNLPQDFVAVCTQDMREGRSSYPPRSGSQGIVK